jgi:hypothetical protein
MSERAGMADAPVMGYIVCWWVEVSVFLNAARRRALLLRWRASSILWWAFCLPRLCALTRWTTDGWLNMDGSGPAAVPTRARTRSANGTSLPHYAVLTPSCARSLLFAN